MHWTERPALAVFRHWIGFVVEWALVGCWVTAACVVALVVLDVGPSLVRALDSELALAGLSLSGMLLLGALAHKLRADTSGDARRRVASAVAHLGYHAAHWPLFFGLAATHSAAATVLAFWIDVLAVAAAIVVLVAVEQCKTEDDSKADAV